MSETDPGPPARARVQAATAWIPPTAWHRVEVLDAHTAGEPLRVILAGFPEPSGATMLAKRAFAQSELDTLRRAVMLEPRGHADMYGALPTAPVTPDADLGVLFMHNAGWSTMCGHGIIGLVKVALDCGLIERGGRAPVLRLDTPAGRVVATAQRDEEGRVCDVSFENVPSFLCARDREVAVSGLGDVRYDLGYGGAFYAYVDAASVGLALEPHEHDLIVERAMRIKRAAAADPALRHPGGDAELEFLYGVIFVRQDVEGVESRNVCVFAQGEVDRSPTGTGVSGRAACLQARGALELGQEIVIESLLGTRFRVSAERAVDEHGQAAIVPRVRGRAWTTGRATLWVDPEDALADGFLLRR